MAPKPRATGPVTPTNRPGPGAGAAPDWNATGKLRQRVLAGLKAGWSPEQVAGRLALEAGRRVISYESIYRFIYAQLARKKDHSWRHYLPRAKSKRGWRGRKGGSSATFIQLHRPLSQRSPDADGRHTPGHWEADLMQFGNRGPVLLTLQERSSRLCFIRKLPGKAAEPVADALEQLLAPFPTSWRKSITFDNGAEFARHYRLHHLGFETFFCDTRSPWQKGGVENANGRLRRYLPRRTDLAAVSDEALTQLNQACNNTPRKCLGYRTPAEIFAIRVLRLKCESTMTHLRGSMIGAARAQRTLFKTGSIEPSREGDGSQTLITPHIPSPITALENGLSVGSNGSRLKLCLLTDAWNFWLTPLTSKSRRLSAAWMTTTPA